MDMRFESFGQYTSRWHQIGVTGALEISELLRWCYEYQSRGAFYFRTEDVVPYRKIEHKHGYAYWFFFELEEDAVLFALTWCGEEAA
jgi:hypothetical protein